MTYIRVVKWDEYQHYGDRRNPPWIKLHTSMLDKPEIRQMPLLTRLLWVELLLLASRSRNATEADLKLLSSQTRIPRKDIREGLAYLAKMGWIKETQTSRPASKRASNRASKALAPRALARSRSRKVLKDQTPLPRGKAAANGATADDDVAFDLPDLTKAMP